MDDQFPVLYILMRTDLPSMNSGKAMAQASHCSNAFLHELPNHPDYSVSHERGQLDLVEMWKQSTPQGFGTVLVLGVTEVQMRTATKVAGSLGFFNGTVNDPTYPYQTTGEMARLVDPTLHTLDPVYNGSDAVCFRSEDTCSWIFGDKNDDMMAAIVGRFKLHP